mgnify:CR=1 FL=1
MTGPFMDKKRSGDGFLLCLALVGTNAVNAVKKIQIGSLTGNFQNTKRPNIINISLPLL